MAAKAEFEVAEAESKAEFGAVAAMVALRIVGVGSKLLPPPRRPLLRRLLHHCHSPPHPNSPPPPPLLSQTRTPTLTPAVEPAVFDS